MKNSRCLENTTKSLRTISRKGKLVNGLPFFGFSRVRNIVILYKDGVTQSFCCFVWLIRFKLLFRQLVILIPTANVENVKKEV